MALRKRKGKAVMDREPRSLADDRLCTQDPLSRQIDDFQAATNQRLLLCCREFQQLVFKQRVRNQEFARKSEESVE